MGRLIAVAALQKTDIAADDLIRAVSADPTEGRLTYWIGTSGE